MSNIPDAPWSADNTAWATTVCDRLGPRRSRLFVSACCRSYLKDPVPADAAEALQVYDRFADTGKTKAAIREARERIGPLTEHFGKFAHQSGNMIETDLLPESFRTQFGAVYNVIEAALTGDWDVRILPRLGLGAEMNLKLDRAGARARLERILAELGFPDPPVLDLDPRWRTENVLGLARAIYLDRAFDRMPLLADALMDAGCDHPTVLDHCRAGGTHYRGCWVLDLILDGRWKALWQQEKPKAAPKSKAAKSPFILTATQKKWLKRDMAVDARDPLAEMIAARYQRNLPERHREVKQGLAQTTVRNRSPQQNLACTPYRHAVFPDFWLDCSRLRRIALNDPGELGRGLSLACRGEWLMDYAHGIWHPLDQMAEVLLRAVAVRDRAVEQRILADQRARKSPSPVARVVAEAIFTAAAGNWEAVGAIAPPTPEDDAQVMLCRTLACLLAIAEGSADRVASCLREHLANYRLTRPTRGWTAELIDLDAHGLYELARRRSPDLVAGFDVTHPPPWDAGFHQWVQAHPDPLADFDWEKIPEEIRAGLRDLPRPAWWDPPAGTVDEPDRDPVQDAEALMAEMMRRLGGLQ